MTAPKPPTREQLLSWAADFEYPGDPELKYGAAVRELLAVVERYERADEIANALNTYVEHRYSCASRKWYPNITRPKCDCGLDEVRAALAGTEESDQGGNT